MNTMTGKLAAATMLAGVGTVAMAGAANASTAHDCPTEAVTHDAHPGLLTGVGGLLGGVAAGLGDVTSPVLDGLI